MSRYVTKCRFSAIKSFIEKYANHPNYKSPTGNTLHAKSWQPEAPLRMFLNNLDEAGFNWQEAMNRTFGPTRDDWYKPYGENSYFIRTKESYSELMQKKLYLNNNIMKSISVDNVINFIENKKLI